MKTFKTKEEAFASQNFDPSLVKLEGVPEQHIEAVKSIINLFVAHDAVNPDFQPDFNNPDQGKYNPYFYGFSPSGASFSYDGYAYGHSNSRVGSRLVSESRVASKQIKNLFEDDYKNFMVYKRKIK